MAKNDDWVTVDVQGVAQWMFHRAPQTDKEYGTTAFKTDLALNEDSKARIDFGPWVTGLTNVVKLLEDYQIKVKDKIGVDVIQFKSKVDGDGDILMHKPIVKDAQNNDFPEGTLIGNGSTVIVRGSLRNYKKTPPLKGRKPMTPFFKAVQVIDLVEYKTDEKSFGPGNFDATEGYTAGSIPTKTVVKETVSESDQEVNFDALESPADLEPQGLQAAKVTTTRRKA